MTQAARLAVSLHKLGWLDSSDQGMQLVVHRLGAHMGAAAGGAVAGGGQVQGGARAHDLTPQELSLLARQGHALGARATQW
eukprot:CAMPEP_0202878318 /NCGR_PEP_ID=MMETSP1391-20130828/32004_1 /ASSEMBLY_ACC=CAM_ASM_000867 /TAXON_ID=1034604 /ORGANISM="Chlamydomonas leiostraca, Strain SAG 11-49" /LENGTH=80 /DNA_ID=CAMNT_0049560487 /DNA_START=8 /DNA_END=247 /DNA_ORIENTATION=-